MTFGERAWHEVWTLIEARRKQNLPVTRSEIGPHAIRIFNRLFETPREMPMCPVCSNPPNDPRYPMVSFAHRSSKSANANRWIVCGCPHQESIIFDKVMSDEGLDSYEVQWRKEIPALFAKATERSTPEVRRIRAEKLGIQLPETELQPTP